MSYTLKMVYVMLTLGVVLSFHEIYWPWVWGLLVLSALVGATGIRYGSRRN